MFVSSRKLTFRKQSSELFTIHKTKPRLAKKFTQCKNNPPIFGNSFLKRKVFLTSQEKKNNKR